MKILSLITVQLERKTRRHSYAQAVTENVEKTVDQNVSSLKKELQLGSGEKTMTKQK